MCQPGEIPAGLITCLSSVLQSRWGNGVPYFHGKATVTAGMHLLVLDGSSYFASSI